MQSDPSQMLSAIFTLSPLTSELPVIQAPQGRFVPLRELCELVGLRPSAYIGVFCRSFRPRQAIQRLPRQTPLGQQEVWCLEQKWLPLWLVKLPLSRLPPDRREQLMLLQETCNVALGWAHQKLLHRQESVRRYAFRILAVCERHESWLQDWEEQGLLLFPPALHQELAVRLIQGHRLGEALATAARRTLRDVLEGPVVDGQLFMAGEGGDTVPLPLLPTVQELDRATPALMQQLQEWLDDFTAWWDAQVSALYLS